MSGIYIDLDQICILILSLRLGTARSLVTQSAGSLKEQKRGVGSNWEWAHKKTNTWIREGLGWWGERSSRCWAPGQGPHKQRAAGCWGLGVELLAFDTVMAVNPHLSAFSGIQVIWKFLRVLVNSITFPLEAQNPPCHFLVIFKTAE